MEQEDICKTCEHYWKDFPMPLEQIISHCEVLDKQSSTKSMDDVVPYPCIKCPFDSYTKTQGTMTREEEIREKAKEIAENSVGERTKNHPANLLHIICVKDACLKMAEWADQHPRKGLWDSKKVTEWLEEHVREFKYYDSDFADGNIDVDGLIETLIKAMED